MTLNWPKGPEQDIIIEVEHFHTEKKCTIPSENKTFIKSLRRRNKLSLHDFTSKQCWGAWMFCHLFLASCRKFCQRELFCPSEQQVFSSQLLGQSSTLTGVFSMVLFFFLFHKLLCKQDRFLNNSCVYLPFSESSYVSPKISNWGYPLTFISKDITKAVKLWLAAHSQGQPWQM